MIHDRTQKEKIASWISCCQRISPLNWLQNITRLSAGSQFPPAAALLISTLNNLKKIPNRLTFYSISLVI